MGRRGVCLEEGKNALPDNTSVDCVIATCNDPLGVDATKMTVREKFGEDVRFFVYEKCGLDSGGEVIHLPNKGREQHTYAHHVANHYDDLSDIVIFTPSNIYHRENSRKGTLCTPYSMEDGFKCSYKGKTFEDLKQWDHPNTYQGRKLEDPEHRGFENWFNHNVGRYTSDTNMPACQHGTFVTTRDIIHDKEREAFVRVENELNKTEPKALHYMERGAPILFGGW